VSEVIIDRDSNRESNRDSNRGDGDSVGWGVNSGDVKWIVIECGNEGVRDDENGVVVNGVLLPLKYLNCLPGYCTRLFSCSRILD
jgi:hypothetical protein